MPNKKISQLNSVDQLFGDEKLLIAQSGTNKTSTVPVLGTKLNSDVGAAVSGLNSQNIGFSGNARTSITGIGSDLAASIGALHRSPNATTAMFVYDTSKDSDGGAWTEKCQHTSWYNETLSGKWLGSASSEFYARVKNATLGPELVSNGTFNDGTTTGWAADVGFWSAVVVGQQLKATATSIGLSKEYYTTISTVAGVLYKFTITVAAVSSASIQIRADGQVMQYVGTTTTPNTYEYYFVASTTSSTTRIGVGAYYANGAAANDYIIIDDVSVKQVTITTASSDYFQLTTDGKFYRLWKNRFSWTEDFTNSIWVKANGSVTMTGVEGLFVPTANAGIHYIGQPRDASTIDRTMTVDVKAAGYTKVAFCENVNTGAQSRVVDLTNGSFVGTAGGGTTVTPLADGWYRISWYSTGFSQFNSNWTIFPVPDSGVNTSALIYNQQWTADGISGIRIRYPQIELASVFTSYERKVADQITSEVFRGNKREFPKLSAIVAEASNVTIYDLTEPGRPMWMLFVQTASQSRSFFPSNASVTSIVAANGVLCIGISGGSQAGLSGVEFIKDTLFRYDSIADRGGYGSAPISNRTTANLLGYTLMVIANRAVNAVAMTVLPDAPVDPATGLQVPTIAVATSSGVSVIKHNGVVVSPYTAGGAISVFFDKSGRLYTGGSNGLSWGTRVISKDFSSIEQTYQTNSYSYASAPYFPLGGTYNDVKAATNNFFLLKNNPTIAAAFPFKPSLADRTRTLTGVVTNTYNTGHLIGDTRRTYLSDVDAGSVSGTELVTNGTFDTDTTGWTGGAWSAAYQALSGGIASQTLTTRIGGVYKITFDKVSTAGGPTGNSVTFGSTNVKFNGLGPVTVIAVATSTSTVISFSLYNAGGGVEMIVDNISVKEVVSDRSYKAKAANITGTLTKSPVATGSQLVAYSGFSA